MICAGYVVSIIDPIIIIWIYLIIPNSCPIVPPRNIDTIMFPEVTAVTESSRALELFSMAFTYFSSFMRGGISWIASSILSFDTYSLTLSKSLPKMEVEMWPMESKFKNISILYLLLPRYENSLSSHSNILEGAEHSSGSGQM